jgi:hypothetical protein
MLILADRLPPESAVNTAVRNTLTDHELSEVSADPSTTPWSNVEGLLAALIDEVRQLSWMYASANSGKSLPKPEPVKRPGISQTRRKHLSIANAQRLDPRLRGLSDEEVQDKLDWMTGGRRLWPTFS